MAEKRGQAATDNMLFYSVVIIGLIAAAAFALNYINTNYNVVQMENTLDNIAVTTDTVSKLGVGSKDLVYVNIPKNVQSVKLMGNSIYAWVGDAVKGSSIGVIVKPVVVGKIPTITGSYYIPVKSVGAGIVKLGDGPWINYLVPDNVKFNQLPLTVKIIGDDFVYGAEVYVDGVSYSGMPGNPGNVNYTSSGEMSFDVIPGLFPAAPGGKIYNISVMNPDSEMSNIVGFTVNPAGGP